MSISWSSKCTNNDCLHKTKLIDKILWGYDYAGMMFSVKLLLHTKCTSTKIPVSDKGIEKKAASWKPCMKLTSFPSDYIWLFSHPQWIHPIKNNCRLVSSLFLPKDHNYTTLTMPNVFLFPQTLVNPHNCLNYAF